jgi:hypothetical protein
MILGKPVNQGGRQQIRLISVARQKIISHVIILCEWLTNPLHRV